jgi:Arc/MetJ family transcription regulator
MKTTLDIPKKLMSEAMELCQGRTKRDLVIRAMEEMVRRENLRQLAESLGESDTFMDPAALTACRESEIPA